MEYLLSANHWRGYTPVTFWNAGVISSSFRSEKTNAQNGDIVAREHTVDRGPSWNVNAGLSNSKLMARNMDSNELRFQLWLYHLLAVCP